MISQSRIDFARRTGYLGPAMWRDRTLSVLTWRIGTGGLTVVDLFALRATNPKELDVKGNPVVPDNVAHIGMALLAAATTETPVI